MTTIWIYRKFRFKNILFGEIFFTFPVRRKLPNQWEEVTTEQALSLAQTMMASKQDFTKEFDIDFRVIVLSHWLRISLDDFFALSDLQVTTLLQIIDPIFEKHPDLSGVSLLDGYMPAPMLIQESTEAFAVYETYYEKVVNGEEGALLRFVSYLLREQGTPVDDGAAQIATEKVKEEPVVQFLLYWWYYKTRQQLVKKYPGAFGKGGGGGRRGPNFTAGHGWWGLMYSVAQDGPFDNYDELKNSEVHVFLDYLEFNHNRMREVEWHQRQNA